MPAALNLSNEVVKMRAEVKRVKVLIIRKLTRQIVALKKKKGSEANVERNQKRAARLLEEIHELKALAPDSVTKAALLSDISFEKVCQKKESSLAERATARIATHPEFSKRIQSIKNAIEAFKAERMSAKKKKKKSTDTEEQGTESELDSDQEEGSEKEEEEENGDDDNPDDHSADDDSSIKIQKADEEQLNDLSKQNKDSVTAKEGFSETDCTPAEVVRMRKEVKKLRVLIIRTLTQQIAALKKANLDDSELKGNIECAERLQKEVHVLRTLLPDHVTIRALEGDIDVEKVFQDPESSALERATARIATHERFLKKLQDSRPAVKVNQSRPSKSKEAGPPPLPKKPDSDTKKTETRNDPEESDLSDSEEEKEYFDDSTEERFRKQSSYSEQSDDDDDFFLGKVSKLKKKKSDTAPRPEKTNHPNESQQKNDKETQEFKMRSVFCSTLSKSSVSSQKSKHASPKPKPFQNQRRDQKAPWVKNHGRDGRERKPPGFRNQTPGSRERGDKTTKPTFDRKNAPLHKAGKHSQQALHPSWEASRKRKEQQAQITAFQGKKIKFDDDDDD
ncbi:Serum response factor-binding protein 1 [Bagarius yarrelli]|uniref:Serum response factor-binding protein 1 n=1 Tax=Bagarius yarrelli TaxID=175774 RepID=A0A556TNW7_BAGYA|nr:Serum response factor-binding protein 1 [Bagarius yarrelli]